MSNYLSPEYGPPSDEINYEFFSADQGTPDSPQIDGRDSPSNSSSSGELIDGELYDLEDLYDLFCDDSYKNTGIVELSEIKEAHTYLSPDRKKLLYDSEKGTFEYKTNKVLFQQCPGFFEYDGHPLNIVEYVSSGSYGAVIRLSSETPLPDGFHEVYHDNKVYYSRSQTFSPDMEYSSQRPRRPEDMYYSIVMKLFKKENDSEIKNVRFLETNKIVKFCNTINITLKTSINPYIGKESVIALMDSMDGNLLNYASDLSPLLELDPIVGENPYPGLNPLYIMKVIVDITRQVADALYCLTKYKIGYSDLKAENILFKCVQGNMVVSLGDLGSLSRIDKGSVCTYPPCDLTMDEKFGSLSSESSMVWGLGIIFLQLLKYPMKKKEFPPETQYLPFEGLKEVFYGGNNNYKRNVVLGEEYYDMVFNELRSIIHNYKLQKYSVKIGKEKYELSHILMIMFHKNASERNDKLKYLKFMELVNE